MNWFLWTILGIVGVIALVIIIRFINSMQSGAGSTWEALQEACCMRKIGSW